MRRLLILILFLIATACTTAPPRTPNEREWSQLMADYQWIQTLRQAQKTAPPGASRKEQIELRLENYRKLEPTYVAFLDKLRDYHHRTGDRRAGQLLANEKIALGDEYMHVLSRYDRAIDFYRAALELDPDNATARQRLTLAQQSRFVSFETFASVKNGMGEAQVRTLVGLPREDWIKQVVQNSRVYSVWIYPKADGGASAIYFDNGVVYHTNWNAAAPPK